MRSVSKLASAITAVVLIGAQAGHAQTATMNPSESDNADRGSSALGGSRPKGAKTEITAQQEATFNNETNTAVFVGKVVVKDPQFTLFCDQLTVLLNSERKGLERATAEGSVIIVQENESESGETTKSTGRSGKAVFEPESGDITLTESPQIQQGINNHIAIDPGTVMILNRDGKLNTIGGSRTVIVDDAGSSIP